MTVNSHWLFKLIRAGQRAAGVFVRDVGQGMLDVSHNLLALLGLGVITALVFTLGHAELRHSLEHLTFDWLQQRYEAREETKGYIAQPDPADAADAADTVDLASLSRQQAAVAQWLSRRYRVAPEPLARLVKESWLIGQRASLDPTLLLAIIAVESNFNPFAQSTDGAQGLMQVITQHHGDKFQAFGGKLAAFDPVSNLRVGAQVLKEAIAQAGGLEQGLRHYMGTSNADDGSAYAVRVLAEQRQITQVATGKRASSPPTPAVAAAQPAQAPRPAAEPNTPPAQAS